MKEKPPFAEELGCHTLFWFLPVLLLMIVYGSGGIEPLLWFGLPTAFGLGLLIWGRSQRPKR